MEFKDMASFINYFIAAGFYCSQICVSIYLFCKYRHKFGTLLFIGTMVHGIGGTLHTLYWGIARLILASGGTETYALMQAPLPFAFAQGVDTISAGFLAVCTYLFFIRRR